MSEWIRREDWEPPADVGILKIDMTDREPEAWAGSSTPGGMYFTHWMPLPAPPPRMVTIEISWDLAQTAYENSRDWPMNSSWRKLGDACEKALEAKR